MTADISTKLSTTAVFDDGIEGAMAIQSFDHLCIIGRLDLYVNQLSRGNALCATSSFLSLIADLYLQIDQLHLVYSDDLFVVHSLHCTAGSDAFCF